MTQTTKPRADIVNIKKARASYVKLHTPEKNDQGVEVFSAELIIPKTDTAAIAALKAATDDAIAFKWKGNPPAGLKRPLKDGDRTNEQRADDGLAPRKEIAGAVHFSAKFYPSKERGELAPKLVERNAAANLVPLTSARIVSGDYVAAQVRAGAFEKAGNKGVGFYIAGVMLLAKGEPLGDASGSDLESAFAGLETEAVADAFADL